MRNMKWMAALLALAVALSAGLACARDLTMEEFMKANDAAALLSRHESIALLQQIGEGQNAVWMNKEYRYSAHRQDEKVRQGDSEYMATDSCFLMLLYYQLRDGVYPVPMIMLDAGLAESPLYDLEAGKSSTLLYDPVTTALEEVRSVEEKDGKLVMTTWLTGENFRNAWEGEFNEGCYAELVYTMDAETLELQEDVETAMDIHGKPLTDSLYYKLFGTTVQTRQQVVYDVPMPKEAQAMLDMIDAYVHAPAEEQRTVTFVFGAGTAGERTVSSTGAKGFSVAFASGDYEYDLYSDPAMTVEAESDDLTSDVTYYVKIYSMEDSI